VERALLSASLRGEDPPDPGALIEAKDDFSRRRFRDLYGIELGPDPELFDVVIENSVPMRTLTREVADADVARFHEQLADAIERALLAASRTA
jgi:cytidylate kinase